LGRPGGRESGPFAASACERRTVAGPRLRLASALVQGAISSASRASMIVCAEPGRPSGDFARQRSTRSTRGRCDPGTSTSRDGGGSASTARRRAASSVASDTGRDPGHGLRKRTLARPTLRVVAPLVEEAGERERLRVQQGRQRPGAQFLQRALDGAVEPERGDHGGETHAEDHESAPDPPSMMRGGGAPLVGGWDGNRRTYGRLRGNPHRRDRIRPGGRSAVAPVRRTSGGPSGAATRSDRPSAGTSISCGSTASRTAPRRWSPRASARRPPRSRPRPRRCTAARR